MPKSSPSQKLDFSALPSLTEYAESGSFGPTSFRGYIVEAGYTPHRVTPKEIKDETDLRYKLHLWAKFYVLEVLDAESGWDPADHDNTYEHYWSLGGKSLQYFFSTNDTKTPAGLSGGFPEQAMMAAGRTEGGSPVTWKPDEGHDVSETRGRWFFSVPGTPENRRKIEPKSGYAIMLRESVPAVEATDPSLILTFNNKKGEEEKTLALYAEGPDGYPLGAEFFVGLEGVWDTKKIALEIGEKKEAATQKVLFLTSFDGRRAIEGGEAEEDTEQAEKAADKPKAASPTKKATPATSATSEGSLSDRITEQILKALPDHGKSISKKDLTPKVLRDSKAFSAKELAEALTDLNRQLEEAPTSETAELVDPAPLFTFDPKTQMVSRWQAT